jgi:hypothetical protein
VARDPRVEAAHDFWRRPDSNTAEESAATSHPAAEIGRTESNNTNGSPDGAPAVDREPSSEPTFPAEPDRPRDVG